MESWRKVWREGVEPLLSLGSLEALRNGLANDDARLLQGATTTPPPSCPRIRPLVAVGTSPSRMWRSVPQGA